MATARDVTLRGPCRTFSPVAQIRLHLTRDSMYLKSVFAVVGHIEVVVTAAIGAREGELDSSTVEPAEVVVKSPLTASSSTSRIFQLRSPACCGINIGWGTRLPMAPISCVRCILQVR